MNETALSLLSENLMYAGQDQVKMDRLSRLKGHRITSGKELPPVQFLFELFGKPCFPRGELVALTGKPKSGKTFVSSILMTLAYRRELLSMKRLEEGPLRVLWYDTEQSDVSTQDILKNRIIPMIGEEAYDEELFLVFNVRQEPWGERMSLLEAAIEEYAPDLVILDGIRDLVNDINDGALAQEVLEQLMQLATEQNCCIVTILHQNKNAEDKNLRGWIGTELTHKAFEVYECRKDPDRVFTLSQQLTRKFDIQDTLRYVVDEQGIPQLASGELNPAEESKPRTGEETRSGRLNEKYLQGWDGKMPVLDYQLLFVDALPEESVMTPAKELQERIMELGHLTSTNLYNSLHRKALKSHVIAEGHDEFGHLCYYRPPRDKPASQTVAPPPVSATVKQQLPEFDFSSIPPPREAPF